MASIAMMIGGAVLNAAAFTGGNYLAKYLSGDGGTLAEKTRHDKALKAYEAAQARYSQERTKLLDWIETNRENKEMAKQLHQHRLRLQTLQPGAPQRENDASQAAKVFRFLPAK